MPLSSPVPTVPISTVPHAAGVRIPIFRRGRNDEISTTWEVIASAAKYLTKKVGAETTFRIKAGGHISDTAAGTGAQEVTIVVIDNAGHVRTEAVATAGASASAATTIEGIRLLDAYVSASGSYPTNPTQASHTEAITIENGAGGTDWGLIEDDLTKTGKIEQGCFTVPTGYSFYLEKFVVSCEDAGIVDGSKLMLIARGGCLEVSAPYSVRDLILAYDKMPLELVREWKTPLEFAPNTDLFPMVKAGTGPLSVTTEMYGYLKPSV